MSEDKYMDEQGIKSVKGLTKYIRNRLFDLGLYDESLECVKVANYVYVYYAVGDTLYREDLYTPVIYMIRESQVETVINNILKYKTS